MSDVDQTLAWAGQGPGGKAERMRTTQAGSSRVDKMDSPIYLRNFATRDSNRSLYRDRKEDVAGACGCRSLETVTKRQESWVHKSYYPVGSFLCSVCREIDFQEGKTKKVAVIYERKLP